MLFEKIMVFSKFLCSLYEKRIEMILIKGSDIKKPARTGFLNDNQLAKDIIKPDIKTFIRKSIRLFYPKKFLILEIGLLKGSYTLSINSIWLESFFSSLVTDCWSLSIFASKISILSWFLFSFIIII